MNPGHRSNLGYNHVIFRDNWKRMITGNVWHRWILTIEWQLYYFPTKLLSIARFSSVSHEGFFFSIPFFYRFSGGINFLKTGDQLFARTFLIDFPFSKMLELMGTALRTTKIEETHISNINSIKVVKLIEEIVCG